MHWWIGSQCFSSEEFYFLIVLYASAFTSCLGAHPYPAMWPNHCFIMLKHDTSALIFSATSEKGLSTYPAIFKCLWTCIYKVPLLINTHKDSTIYLVCLPKIHPFALVRIKFNLSLLCSTFELIYIMLEA